MTTNEYNQEQNRIRNLNTFDISSMIKKRFCQKCGKQIKGRYKSLICDNCKKIMLEELKNQEPEEEKTPEEETPAEETPTEEPTE